MVVLTASAVASSLHFFFDFDFDFLVFFGHAGISVAVGVPFDAGPVAFGARLKAFLCPSVGGMKLSCSKKSKLATQRLRLQGESW